MDVDFTNRLRKCADDIRRGDGVSGAPLALELAASDIDELRELVIHCWIHSGYRECGREQMTSDQKAFFDSVVNGDAGPAVAKEEGNG